MGTTTGDFNRLFADIEELIKRVSDRPDIQNLLAKIRTALETAKTAVAEGADQARRQARAAAERTDTLVRENPWSTAGVAILCGIGLGVALVAMRRD